MGLLLAAGGSAPPPADDPSWRLFFADEDWQPEYYDAYLECVDQVFQEVAAEASLIFDAIDDDWQPEEAAVLEPVFLLIETGSVVIVELPINPYLASIGRMMNRR